MLKGSVYLNFELYAHWSTNKFLKISNMGSASRTITELASPNNSKLNCRFSSLVGYKRDHIFNTGGKSKAIWNNVSVYWVNSNSWSQCANLNFARHGHASCVLGNSIYVSGGCDKEFNDVDQIEKADCKSLIKGLGYWRVLSIRHKSSYFVFTSISDHEILIMGG